MRKYYLDNLRTLMILLLFPVHTFMIWNDYGTKFYVWGGESKLLSSLITLVNPWFMSILFVIAGMCANYSLRKRSIKGFVKERFSKLMLPFISGMILLIPFQTLYARKFFFGYNGSLFDNFKYFFTNFTDLSGYDGCFTPGHLWFILFLFVISILSLVVIKLLPYEKIRNKTEKMNIAIIILLFVPVWLFYYIGNFGGFSLGKDLMLYLLGYYVLSNELIMQKIIKWKRPIVVSFCILQAGLSIAYYQFSYYGDLGVNIVGWLGVLSFLIIGNEYFNKKTKITDYLSKASFPVYILHQTILVISGYYVLLSIDNIVMQVLIIMAGSFLLTFLCYEIIRRIPYLRKLFGMK